jgi:uncharacterized protein involved in type VI secretion and phage assembly
MYTPSFKLNVDGIELTLIEFDGEEEMNRLFKYTFKTEIPTNPVKKLADVIDGDATFTIVEFNTSVGVGDIAIPGYISKASKTSNEWILEFQPKLKKTTTNSRSEIYFQENASLSALTVIQSEFDDDIYLSDRTPVFDVTSTLPNRKLFCQFHESNWNYVARLCDHWGFHFYFDHYDNQIVFADNNQYDQKFTTQLKTTSSTADNSQLKILNWQETLTPTESYTKIVGYDYENAGTAINASYPTNGPSQSVLTESSQTLSDVNSQDEAEYIAQIRHEANNCRNHLATGEAKIPYLMPGLLIDTDDSDFSKALIIKTVNRARNLNSTNSGTAASFVCQFEAIPENICFRPDTHYAIPLATNIVGKVISETADVSLAQRSSTGEYKAELLGFENENSSHPWLRKAQTTAGTNGSDIPLTPNTEVLISFFDSNPNCPYIQHALNNSLHPAPVTNANPHHAVTSTDGMLLTSSATGRFNFSTTKEHKRQDDNTLSSTIKNYYTGRGEFSQNENFIDPSSVADAADFSFSDHDSGEYIFTRHYGDSVEIREGDKLHWHNGNIYDFGGYWNYNLGNSYEENYLNQKALLNQKTSLLVSKDISNTDLLQFGGPSFEVVEWIKLDGKVDLTSSTKDYPFSGGDPKLELSTTPSDEEKAKPFFKDNINTSKTFSSNSYDFSTQCNSIEISDRCNSLEITHREDATKTVELNFHGGTLRSLNKTEGRSTWGKSWNGSGTLISESSSVGGVTEETNWHSKGSNNKSSYSKTTKSDNSIAVDAKSYNINTGALATHNISTFDGMGKAEMDFSFQTTAAANFNFGASTSFSISAQANASLAISLSGGVDIKLEAGINLEVKLSGGMTFEMKKDLGGLYKLKNGKFVAETEATILAATTAATLEAIGPTIKTVQAEITSTNAKLRKEMVTLDQSNVKLDTSYLVVFQ